MDKKIGIAISLLLIYFIYAQKESIQSFFLERYNAVKSSYFDTVFYLINLYELHFHQAATIQSQKQLIDTLTKTNLSLLAYKHQFQNLKQEPILKDIIFVNAISYVKLANNNRLWLNRFEGYDSSKTYGATDGKYSSGIVVDKDGKPMILLNSDPQAIYGVYVGSIQAPGVIYGIDHQKMIVEYIPQWMDVKVGDEVKTSGLDSIFSAGVAVGEVSRVEDRHGYKVAYVQPYANSLSPSFFYLMGN